MSLMHVEQLHAQLIGAQLHPQMFAAIKTYFSKVTYSNWDIGLGSYIIEVSKRAFSKPSATLPCTEQLRSAITSIREQVMELIGDYKRNLYSLEYESSEFPPMHLQTLQSCGKVSK